MIAFSAQCQGRKGRSNLGCIHDLDSRVGEELQSKEKYPLEIFTKSVHLFPFFESSFFIITNEDQLEVLKFINI